jgi:hypothetical protein
MNGVHQTDVSTELVTQQPERTGAARIDTDSEMETMLSLQYLPTH